jgi:hypothetical protein
LSRTVRGIVSATVLAAGCLSLGGCLGLPASTGSLNTAAAPEPTKPAAADKNVDDVTKRILQAAGLDPSDPSQPKEIGRNVAGVVQVRYQGHNYGTALARPLPGRVQFVEPNQVAAMLAGPTGNAKLAAALKGPLVDIDSRDCHFNQKHDRRTRKALRRARVCPAPSGAIWADLHRREMTVEIKMASEYASLVKPPNNAVGPEAAGPVTIAAFEEATTGPSAGESAMPASAPIAPRSSSRPAATVDPARTPPTPGSPWDALLTPTRTASQAGTVVTPILQPAPQASPPQKIALNPPAPPIESDPAANVTAKPSPEPVPIQQPQPQTASVVTVSSSPSRSGPPSPVLAVSSYSAPNAAVPADEAELHPRLFSSSNPVRVVDDSYAPDRSMSFNNVSVISGAYQPRSSSSFR